MEENLNGTPIAHEYDQHGRRIGSSGSKTARQYQWTKHQLQQLSVGEHTPLQFAYHPCGQEQTRATEQGFSLHHQWSDTGLLLEQQLGTHGDSLRQYQYDALDRLVGIDDAKRGQSRFSLNANGQVQAERQQKRWESQQRFVHLFGYDSELNLNQQGFATEYGDSDSNVVSLDDERVKRQSRQYDKAGRVLDTGRFRYHYDRCGRVIEKTEYKDGYRPKTTRFVWNGDDRLTHIELPDGGRYRYRYDPLGRRVAKECLSTQRITEYLWDGANIVQHSQKSADGSVIQAIEYLYEPETFRPLAQVTHKADQASQLHYIVTDHAGTPQELCSENGEVVWQGEQALWGHYQQQNTLPNHGFRENAHNDELYCDLRYQGQIEDRESGLYYNVNRYYDADSGQYLSPDLIGFAGGLRPQAYVFNPLEWVDPLGLAGEAHEGTGQNVTKSGPVEFRAPPEATAEEIAQVKKYCDGCNAALADGALSPTGRVSTKGKLRRQASRAAAKEKKNRSYTGHAGHVPDTTWAGTPQPHSWMDLTPRVNASLGGQAGGYPVGYKPTNFIFKE